MANISNTISIKITSDTKDANNNITGLVTQLEKLKKASTGINIKITGLSKTTIDNINRFSQINSTNIANLAQALTALSQVGKIGSISKKTIDSISNLVAEVDKIKPETLTKLERLAAAMSLMHNIRINLNGINSNNMNQPPSNAQRNNSNIPGGGVNGGTIFGGALSDLKSFTSQIGAAIAVLEKYFKFLGKIAMAIGKVAVVAFKGATAIERFMFAFGKNVISGIANKIAELSKKFNKAVAAISRIAVYRALRRAIQLVAQAFTTGTENLYEYSRVAGTDLYQNLDKMSSALMQMKNAIGSAVAPLINAFTPVILTLINAVTVLCDKIAQFVSLLSGVSKYSKAIGTSFSFEDAISGTGKAAGSASKELNKFTTSIDELNVISENSSSGGGSSSYDSTTAFTENLATWWSDLAEIFSLGKFITFGQELAKKFNGMIDSIDMASLGTKLGQRVRDMAESAFGFLSTFNASSIGTKLAEFINNGIKAIPWNLIGQNWALLRNKFIDAFVGFVNGLNWEEVSSAISEFFNGAIETIDIVKLADGVATAAVNIVGCLADAITGMDLGTAFDKLFQAGMKFLETMSDSDVIERVIGALNHIIDAIQPEKVTEFINKLKDWFGKCWTKMRDEIKWEELCQKIGNALANVDWGAVLKLCFSIIKSVWTYTKIFTTNVWKPLCEAIGSAFWNEIKSSVNSMLGLDTDNPIGKRICDAIRTSIDAWLRITLPFYGLVENFKDIISEIEGLWADFTSGIEGKNMDYSWLDDYQTSGSTSGYTSGGRTFASGGYPPTGDFFYANENGPELVGRIGSRTAVANQGQIVDAVSAGVYEAVVSAFSGQKSSRENINLSVYLDGKQIESSVRKTTQNRGANIATGGVINYSYA